MSEEIGQQADLQIKRKYLWENVIEKQHDDFGNFCLSYVGNQNIHLWSLDYVKELVAIFNKTKVQQVIDPDEDNNPHQNRFEQYQTTDRNQAKIVLENIQREEAITQTIQQPANNHETIKNNKQNVTKHNQNKQNQNKSIPKQSAVALLNQVFDKVEKEQHSPPPNQLKAQSNFSNFQQNFATQKVPQPSFDNDSFWPVPITNNSKIVEENKSQSSETFKYLQSAFFNDFINSKQFVNNNQTNDDQKNKNTNTSVLTPPSVKTQKVYSPYQKKQQVLEVAQQRGKSQTIRIKQIKQLKKSELSQREKKIVNKIPYDGTTVFKDKFEDSVPCFKSSIRNALSHPDLNVLIQKHQIVQRSFFVPDYVMYTLRVLPSQTQCKRNYEDFTKLRSSLQRVYPGIQLPYLQKNSWLSQTNAEFIKKQKLMLQFFLADIIRNKQLRNCRMFQDFLSINQHKKIKRKFQEYDKMEKLTGIQQLCLLEGKVDVKITQQHRIYQQKAQRFILTMEQFMQRHKRLSQSLSYQYECILTTLTSLSDLMKEAEQQVKNFNNKVMTNQINILQEAFNTLYKGYKEKYIHIKFENDMLTKKVLPFLKYEQANLQTLKQLLNVSNQMTKRYMRRLDTENTNTNQPYLSEKLKHYKTGILEESKNIFVFKYQVGFINNQACNEFQRFFEQFGIKHIRKWGYIADKNLDRLGQSMDFWRGIRVK